MSDDRIEIDVNARRDLVIAFNGLTGADEAYTFYYDESNNPRRLHVTAAGFNVETPQCFVLGGVAHLGPPRPLDIVGLRKAVGLQSTAKELKRENLGKGDFLKLLGMWKVEAFIDWVAAEHLLAHYFALDPLYWAIVDVIDSILSDDQLAQMRPAHLLLKADLFTVLAGDWKDAAVLFHRYDYPNVGAARTAFIDELIERLEARSSLLPDVRSRVLGSILDAGRQMGALVFLEDEEPNTIIDSFSGFFLERLCLFKNAEHVLDVEEVVQAKLANFALVDGARELTHFRFADSIDEAGVQVSDVLVGLLGKFFSYVCRTEAKQIIADRRSLTNGQTRTLAKLNSLLDRSQEQSPALTQQVAALRSLEAGRFLLEGS